MTAKAKAQLEREDETPDDLPEGWEIRQVRDLFDCFGGGTPNRSTSEYWGGSIPWLSSGDIKSDRILSASESITKAGLKNSSAAVCRPGSLAVVVRSGILAHSLPVAVLQCRAAINQDIKCFDCGNDDLNAWLVMALRSSAKEILALNREGTTVQSVKYDTLKDFCLQIPPLSEQRRIVAKIDELLARVNASRNRLAKVPKILKVFRQSVLAAACSGHLTEDWRERQRDAEPAQLLIDRLMDRREKDWRVRELAKFSAKAARPKEGWEKRYKLPPEPQPRDDMELPESWRWATLAQVARLDVGFAFKSTDFSRSGIRLLRGENVVPDMLRWEDVRFLPVDRLPGFEDLLVESGEVILAMDRPLISSGLKLARAANDDVPCLLVQRVTRFKMYEPQSTGFVYACLQDRPFINHLLAHGLSGSDLPHITGTAVAEFTVPMPPVEEQQEIVRRIDILFKLADKIENRVQAATKGADKLTQSVLAKAFRGELVPTEAELARQEGRDYEPASVLLERIKSEREKSAVAPKAAKHRTTKAARR